MNWMESDEIYLTEDILMEPLERFPGEGEFVVVMFATKKTRVYYIGKVLETRNDALEYFISFLRLQTRGPEQFSLPDVPDVSYVKEHDIKYILPKPIISGSTKRQQSYYKFAVTFAINIR